MYDVIHLIGSVIHPHIIESDLAHSRAERTPPIAFWGCGMRDAQPVPAALLDRCRFFGVRGPRTRDVLALPPDTVLGDPALLLPLLYEPGQSPHAGKTICIPHFLEQRQTEDLLSSTGADLILRPNLPIAVEELLTFIDAIAGAKFIFAGALHAAIVACAYGTPFSYFDSGFIDIPFKWEGFAQSVGASGHFEKTVEAGLAHYESAIRPRLRIAALAPILRGAPWAAPQRLIARAEAHDQLRMQK